MKWLRWVVTLAVLVVTAWLLWNGSDAAPDASRAEPGPVVEASSSSAVPAQAEAPLLGSEDAHALDSVPTAERELVEGDAPEVLARAACSVLVVEGVEQTPVAGAEVEWLAVSDDEAASWHLEGVGLDVVDRWPAEQRSRASSDSNGRVSCHPTTQRAVVVARAAGRFGYASWSEREAKEPVVTLHPDGALEVRVVDPAAHPVAGAEVRLRPAPEGGSFLGPAAYRSETDALGIARFGHAGAYGDLHRGRRLIALVAALTRAPAEVEVPSSGHSGVPLVISLPWTAPIEVRWRASREDLRPSGLSIRRAATQRWRFAELSRFEPREREAFALIEVGLQVVVELDTGQGMRDLERQVTSSSRAGEPTVVEFDLDAELASVRFRLLDPTGAPVVSTKLAAELRIETGPDEWQGSSVDLATDDQGVVRFSLAASTPEKELNVLEIGLLEGTEKVARARVELPRELPQGESDLGDVRLTALWPLLAGRVVDDLGRPIPRTILQPMIEVRSPDARGIGGRLELVPGVMHLTTDDEGRFRIHGDSLAERFTLFVHAHQGPQKNFYGLVNGTLDLELVVARPGGLTGSVLLDPDQAPSQVTVTAGLAPPPGEKRASGTRYGAQLSPTEGGATFELAKLEPGLHRVEIRIGGFSASPVVSVDVEVRAGESQADPRLQAIDLRGRIRSIDVTVLDQQEQPLDHGFVLWRPHGTTERWQAAELGAGGARIVGEAASFDLVAHSVGRTAEWAEAVDESREFRLGPAIVVEVARGALAIPEGVEVSAELRAVPESTAAPDWVDLALAHRAQWWVIEASGTCKIPVPYAGSYAVTGWVSRPSDTRSGRRPLHEAGLMVEVDHSTSGQPARLAFTQAAFDAALASLDAQR